MNVKLKKKKSLILRSISKVNGKRVTEGQTKRPNGKNLFHEIMIKIVKRLLQVLFWRGTMLHVIFTKIMFLDLRGIKVCPIYIEWTVVIKIRLWVLKETPAAKTRMVVSG